MPNDFAEQHGWSDPAEEHVNSIDTPIPEGVPAPTLWRVVIMPVQPPKMSKGGLALPDMVKDAEEHLNYIGRVVAIGPMAGRDAKFQGTLTLEVGGWVLFKRYQGMNIHFKGTKLCIINDDQIVATIESPEGFRVYV